MTQSEIVQIISAIIGTIGFGLYFRVKKKRLLVVTFGGFIAWVVYLLCYHYTYNIFICNMISAIVVSIYSEVIARTLKAPSTVFMLPSLVPLLPGGALYYTMSGIVQGNIGMIGEYGLQTIKTTFGIAFGVLVSTVFIYRPKNNRTTSY